MVVRTFVFTVVSVVLGMMTLMPQVLLLVLPPLAVGLGLFLSSLPALARRQRAFILADETTVKSVTAMVGGLRDIAACGAEGKIGERVDRQVEERPVSQPALPIKHEADLPNLLWFKRPLDPKLLSRVPRWSLLNRVI